MALQRPQRRGAAVCQPVLLLSLLSLLLPQLLLAHGSPPPPITPSTSLGEYLAAVGIPFERHFVTTPDKYVLQLHRLPNPGRPVVFLQHGILASTWCWPPTTLNECWASSSTALDTMWALGTTGHWATTQRRKLIREFWNFTFHEMGKLDFPHFIDAALSIAGNQTSLRPTAVPRQHATLVAGSDPTIASRLRGKVNIWIALSPVSYLYHSTSALTISSRLKLGLSWSPSILLAFGRVFMLSY